MMRFKFLFVIILIFFVSISGFSMNPADGDKLFVFSKQSSVPVAYSLDDLDKITFSDTGVKFWNTSWPTEYVYDSFNVIAFDENKQSNNIGQIPVNDSNVSIVFERSRNMVCVKSAIHLSGVSVFDLQGRSIAKEQHPSDSYEIDISSMPSGVFIVKVNEGGNVVSKKIIK